MIARADIRELFHLVDIAPNAICQDRHNDGTTRASANCWSTCSTVILI